MKTGLFSSVSGLLLVLYLLTHASPALALNCDEILVLWRAGVSDDLIMNTVRQSSPRPAAHDLKCLMSAEAPQSLIQQMAKFFELDVSTPHEERKSPTAPVHKAVVASDFFPQPAGSYWQYDLGGMVFLQTVISTRPHGTTEIQNTISDPNGQFPGIAATIFYELKEGVWLETGGFNQFTGKIVSDPPRIVLPNILEPGATWNIAEVDSFTGRRWVSRYTVDSIDSSVRLPSGLHFPECVVIRHSQSSVPDPLDTLSYYVAGLGFVGVRLPSEGTWIQYLVRYSIPK